MRARSILMESTAASRDSPASRSSLNERGAQHRGPTGPRRPAVQYLLHSDQAVEGFGASSRRHPRTRAAPRRRRRARRARQDAGWPKPARRQTASDSGASPARWQAVRPASPARRRRGFARRPRRQPRAPLHCSRRPILPDLRQSQPHQLRRCVDVAERSGKQGADQGLSRDERDHHQNDETTVCQDILRFEEHPD